MTEPSTILVVEDRREVLDVLRRALREGGYSVVESTDGDEALARALDLQPDLVILDVGLPSRSGIDVARELRRRGFRAPVLMLTARMSVSDKVEGLEAGADDYVIKPFDCDELLARVRALLRRAALRDDDTRLQVGDLVIDLITRSVTRGDRVIALTQKEYALLEYLARHAGRPVTREQIAEQVWKAPLEPGQNIVDVYVSYLRAKLDGGAAALLHTVRGVGYVLSATPPEPGASRGG